MWNYKFAIGIISLLVFTCFNTKAQHRDDSLSAKPSIEASGHYGFFIANQPKSLYLRNDHSRLLEVAISFQTTGQKVWQRESNLPRIGFGFLYGSLGSAKYLGNMAAMYPFIHFPLSRGKRSVTSFRLGAGAGWVQKPYDRETNYKNLMISTHINAVISLRLQSEWQVVRNLHLNAGLAFTHLSNGGVRLPNLGLNVPSISAGIRYGPSSANITKPAKNSLSKHQTFSRRTNLLLQAAIAFKQTYPLESPVQPVEILNVELVHALNAVSRIAGGLAFSYDHSLSKEIYNAPTYVFEDSESKFQGSVYGGYEHVVGRLSIPIQLGVYFYNNYKISELYQMIGLRYRFTEKIFASLQLKAHFGKADFIQYGIGYKIF